MTVEEKVQYIDDFFKRRIHDDGYDDLLEVSTRALLEPADKESFVKITFILNRQYSFRHILSSLVIDEVVNTREYLNYIYDNAKESLFKEQRRDIGI